MLSDAPLPSARRRNPAASQLSTFNFPVLLPEIIDTPRLRLRKPLVEDANEIFRNYAADPEVTRYLTWRPHYSLQESFDVMVARLAHWEQGTEFTWSITPRDSGGTVMGMVSAAPDARAAWRWTVGYVLGKPWWDQGFMHRR